MTVLADIGGTYARFGYFSQNTITSVRKYNAADFPNLQTALAQYCEDEGLKPRGDLKIATAGYEDAGVWKFVNKNKWHIDLAALKATGWNVEKILNDFEAATWAIPALRDQDQTVLKPGSPASKTRCMIGPGTGLGLGYFHEGPPAFVQKTHGGNMPLAGITDEHFDIIKTVQLQKTDNTIPVFENVVSGPGLQTLYRACCALAGKNPQDETPEAILANSNKDQQSAQALRLFHEFFGVFAATVVITGHAYGGLYIGGGVTEHLEKEQRFDFAHFEKFFCLNAVDSIKRDLSRTPIIRMTDPHPAFKGLLHA